MIIPGNYVPGKILLGWSSGFYLAVQKRTLANDRQIRFERFRTDHFALTHKRTLDGRTRAVAPTASVHVPFDRVRAMPLGHRHPPLLLPFASNIFFLFPSFHFALKCNRTNIFRYRKIECPLTNSNRANRSSSSFFFFFCLAFFPFLLLLLSTLPLSSLSFSKSPSSIRN